MPTAHIIALCTALLLGACAASQPPRPPNIVIVLLDDLGYSDYGAYGSEIRTPHIDALADNGVVLDQFYVTPRCSPTRAALLTGEDPHTAGLGFLPLPEGADAPPGPYQGYLAQHLETLPQALGRRGYATYMSGKWHLGEAPRHWPTRYGFDRYFGLISGASSYYTLREDEPLQRRMALDDQPWQPPPAGFYMTEAFSQQAVDYLHGHTREQPQAPFFLYLSYTAPHWPLHAPEEAIAPYRQVYAAGAGAIAGRRAAHLGAAPPAVVDADPDSMAVYAAQVTLADEGVGRLVDTLRRTGRLDDTLILVFSDNGASAEDISGRQLHQAHAGTGAPGSYLAYGDTWATVSNTPLRGHKGTTFEGGIRAPLIAHWPNGGLARGQRDVTSIASVREIMPMLLAAADGAPAPLLEALRGTPRANPPPIFWAHAGWAAVRDGDWKAVRTPGSSVWQLFNLRDDPTESRPLTQPALLADLTARWSRWAETTGVDPAFDPRTYYQQRFRR